MEEKSRVDSPCVFENDLNSPPSEVEEPDELDIMFPKNKSHLEELHSYAGKRPQWHQFTDEWLAKHPCIGAETPNEIEVFETAVAHFNANGRFFSAWETWTSELRETRFWETIKCALTISSPIGERLTKKQLNETILALRRYVSFESKLGNAPLPKVREEPELDESKQPIFTANLYEFCGGLKQADIVEWVLKHAAAVHAIDRARTRPLRRAKDALRIQRRQMEAMRASWIGWAVWGTIDMLRGASGQTAMIVDTIESWWGRRQNVAGWVG
jgi:hypothetical protein